MSFSFSKTQKIFLLILIFLFLEFKIFILFFKNKIKKKNERKRQSPSFLALLHYTLLLCAMPRFNSAPLSTALLPCRLDAKRLFFIHWSSAKAIL